MVISMLQANTLILFICIDREETFISHRQNINILNHAGTTILNCFAASR